MPGLAATIFEKTYRAALRGKKVIDVNLLRNAARRVLILILRAISNTRPFGRSNTGERNRKMRVT